MSADALFQIGQFSGQFLMRGQLFAHENERADHPDTGFNGNRAVQNAGKHESAVLGKNPAAVDGCHRANLRSQIVTSSL